MIQNVINSIIEAEAEAEKILKDANVTAKDIKMKAKLDSEKMIKENANQVKEALKNINAEANEMAKAENKKIIEEGKKEASKLLENSNSEIEKASEFIAGRLLKKYGNS